MTELSDTDDGEIKSEFSQLTDDLAEEIENNPKIAEFVEKLSNHIKKQNKRINKLQKKLAKLKKLKYEFINKERNNKETQTEEKNVLDWNVNDEGNITNLVDQVTLAAESAVQQTGFVYEKTSGLYYDYNTGYYYDSKLGLYYDGNKGMYLIYDKDTESYKFHSQVVPESQESKSKKKTRSKRKETNSSKDEAKKCKLQTSDDSDALEEGECLDDNSSDSVGRVSPQIDNSSDSENDNSQDIAKIYPPCIRIVVKETSLSNLKIGTLFLVTFTGGSLGREGDHAVLIHDINISKHHARFQYNDDKTRYEIVDLGSRNGTYLNGKRLSVAKQESEPHEITHGSTIQIGSTKLLCHVHSGNATCGHCEPGLLQTNENATTTSVLKKNQHKTELKWLKTKFGVDNDNIESASQVAAGYQDRAQARRKKVGSSDQHAKTQQSSLNVSINKNNKGFKLLSKMGWSEGNSLGKSGEGILEPVPLVKNASKAGLGSNNINLSELEVDPGVEKKRALWQKTQQRYYEIPE